MANFFCQISLQMLVSLNTRMKHDQTQRSVMLEVLCFDFQSAQGFTGV